MLVIGVGFHELSHLWAAKRLGYETKGFYLVPFMGGVAFVKGPYKSYADQAFVVLLGPIGGGLLALATLGAYHLIGVDFLAAAALWMCYLNFFNLLPLAFMDGGQLMDTITYSVNRTFGMVLHIVSTLVAAVGLWFLNPILALVVTFFGGVEVIMEIRNWKAYRDGRTWLCSESYLHPPVPLSKLGMLRTSASWFLTMVVLFLSMLHLRGIPVSDLATLIHK